MKKDVKLILIISLVIVVLIGGCFFILMKSGKVPVPVPDKTTTTTTTSSKDLTPTDRPYGNYNDEEDIQKILSASFNLYGVCATGKEFTNNESTINDLTEDNKISTAFAFISAYENYEKTPVDENKTVYKYTIDKNVFLTALEALYGYQYRSSYQLKDTINILGNTFTLEGDNLVGNITTNACITGKNPRYYFIKSYLEYNTYYIEYAFYYHEYELNEASITSKVYASKDSTNVICTEDAIASNLESLTKYRFSLVREGENFILEKITKF